MHKTRYWQCEHCYRSTPTTMLVCEHCGADQDGDFDLDLAVERGCEDWNRDKPLSANPYPVECDAWEAWREAWTQARVDNSQFGVGA